MTERTVSYIVCPRCGGIGAESEDGLFEEAAEYDCEECGAELEVEFQANDENPDGFAALLLHACRHGVDMLADGKMECLACKKEGVKYPAIEPDDTKDELVAADLIEDGLYLTDDDGEDDPGVA